MKPKVPQYRRDPKTDPHLPHTTRYVNRDDLQIPPEAQKVIDAQWPEVVRTMQQYDMGAGMLMLYGLVRDACKAAGWGDDMAYLMRDYLIGKMNKAKVRTYTGTDTSPGDWQTFHMGESSYSNMKVTEGKHKAGCQCGFCKNKGSFGKKKAEDEKPDEKKPTAESIVKKLLDD